jgi:hypothetical protein
MASPKRCPSLYAFVFSVKRPVSSGETNSRNHSGLRQFINGSI